MMAKKRILSWLVAASLALSLLPTAVLAADETQEPTAAQTLEIVKEAKETAVKAKEDAVAAQGKAEAAKETVEKITDKVAEDNKAIDQANKTYTDGQKAEEIVDDVNKAVEEKAAEIESEIDLTKETAVNDVVNGKIEAADAEAQKALDAITKADEADEESTSLAQKAAAAREEAEKLAASVNEQSEQEAIKEAADKAQDAADIAQEAANKAQEAVDNAKEAYEAALETAKEALEAAKTIDATLKEEANVEANETVKEANEVTGWLETLEPKAEMSKDDLAALKANAEAVLNDAEADQLKKNLAQAALNYVTAQDAAAEAAAQADNAKNAATTAKNEQTLNAVISVLDIERDDLNCDKGTNVEVVKENIDKAASAYVDSLQTSYDNLFNGKGEFGDYHPVIQEDIKKENLPIDKVIELQKRLKAATTNQEKKAIAVEFGVNPARVPIDLTNISKNAFLEHDLPRMLDARINLLAAEDIATAAKEAAEAVVDAQVAQQKADEAKTAANDALEKYEAARKALIERETLKELYQQSIDLTALEKKLADAERNWKDAEDAAKKAQDDADEAQKKADDISDLIDDSTTPGTNPEDPTPGTDDPTIPGTDDADDADAATTIADDAVPLALMPTRGELMNYLYVRAGSPEAAPATFTDVPADHEFALAIGWAQANGIAVAYEDGTFDPDNFVIAADMVTFLEGYAKFSGMTVTFPLAAMAGLEDDAIVENADAILAEFFGD